VPADYTLIGSPGRDQIPAWILSYRYPGPTYVCVGGSGGATQGPPTTLSPACTVNYTAMVINASTGEFDGEFFYG
jgi:hypothetical protein